MDSSNQKTFYERQDLNELLTSARAQVHHLIKKHSSRALANVQAIELKYKSGSLSQHAYMRELMGAGQKLGIKLEGEDFIVLPKRDSLLGGSKNSVL